MNRRDFAKGLGLLPILPFARTSQAVEPPKSKSNFSYTFETNIKLEPLFELGSRMCPWRYIEFPYITELTIDTEEIRLTYCGYNIGAAYRDVGKQTTEEWLYSIRKWCSRVQPKVVENLMEATINPQYLLSKDLAKIVKNTNTKSNGYQLYGETFYLSHAMILNKGEGFVKT